MTEFTGEFFLPGQTKKRLFDDHFGRYEFAAAFARGKRVLDIACGSGYGSYLVASSGAAFVQGADLSREAIAEARRRFVLGNLSYDQGDLLEFSAPDPFDLIISFETIEHIDDFRKAIERYRQLLAEDGLLLISSPNRNITSPDARSIDDSPNNRFHVREFTVEELIWELEKGGFQVDRDQIFGQRLQFYFKNRLLLKIYKKIFQPHKLSNRKPKKFKLFQPRYFVLLAKKKPQND
jgi:SAM-dependent methyltransferase